MILQKVKHKYLYRSVWLIFFCFVLILLTNLGLFVTKDLTTRSIPFSLKDGRVVKLKDQAYETLLHDKIVTQIDSFETFSSEPEEERKIEASGINFNLDEDIEGFPIFENIFYPQLVNGREIIEITLKDTISGEISQHPIKTYKIINIIKLFQILLYLFLLIFSLFNSYILIRFSQSKENLLVVFFLLFLFSPKATSLLNPLLLDIWSSIVSPFWGILFYHFIVLKTKVSKNIRKIYIITLTIFFGMFIIRKLGISIAIHNIWASFWLIKGFLLLRKQYKKNKDIDLKRLLGAFGGIGFSLFSILALILFALFIALAAGISSIAGLSNLLESYEFLGLVIGITALLPIVGFALGIFWFFGSFSWSLLTGTVLDVKIRSTLIYSLVGFIFIVIFGLIDYSLGEILQSLFGKFLGSEFIAGIPATIGLLLFFNPVRNYAERVVDKRLNSSDLDFLEKADTFTRNISEEGIIEGFEEYICDNLISKLPIAKVAIVSFDQALNNYKYNEIRGVDILENSITLDEKKLLSDKDLIKIPNPGKNDQDISSFNLIITILNENQYKWFLAFGKKKDNSVYNKKDIEALRKLVEKVRLSLKFILTYENLTKDKYTKMVSIKEKKLREKDKKILELESIIKKLKSENPKI